MTFDLSLVSALTALVAVIVSPVVSVYVARRQIRASVVSSNRYKWIDQLRDQLAELVSLIRFLDLYRKIEHITEAEWIDRFQKAFVIEQKIKLLINPNEPDHAELVGDIRAAVTALLDTGHEASDDSNVVALTDTVIRHSQTILKREWERVKRGD